MTTTASPAKTPEQIRREREQAARWKERQATAAAPGGAPRPGAEPPTSGTPPRTGTGGRAGGGGFNSNTWDQRMVGIYNDVMDPTRADPTTDPIFQNVADQIREDGKRDFLGLYGALSSNAEAGGRYGSGTWQALAHGAQRETEGNVYDAIERMFAGEVNTNRDRIAGLYGDIGNYNSGMVNARANARNSRTNAAQFRFNRDMALADAQQDALNDYYNILAGIGGWGGSTWGMSTSPYQSSMDPTTAAIMGGVGGYIDSGSYTGSGWGSATGGSWGNNNSNSGYDGSERPSDRPS